MIYGVFDYVILLSVITVFYNVNPTWNNYYYFFILEAFLFFLKNVLRYVIRNGQKRPPFTNFSVEGIPIRLD